MRQQKAHQARRAHGAAEAVASTSAMVQPPCGLLCIRASVSPFAMHRPLPAGLRLRQVTAPAASRWAN
ncbi:MAG: hypothetical protein KY444_10205, partial [Gemmatimonadetes bacterium]|nr:hypothetical protein [Gemmatimonadota bacterium]